MRFEKHVLRRLCALALVSAAAALLAGCEDNYGSGVSGRGYRPLSSDMLSLMDSKSTDKSAPVLIRTFKKEAELEIWKMNREGRYARLKTYPMCRWSGQLGPKTREGDRQVPEGFYNITPGQMNPNSAYYLSFNVGYPNAYDRAYGRDGGSIMVHGACSSAGCYSMTDEQIAEIYAVAREGLSGGQHAIQMQSFPFRMTAENLAKYRLDPNIAFWKELKEGSDAFEVSKQDVSVGVCNKHYVFNATPADGTRMDALAACPPLKRDSELQAEVAAKAERDAAKVAELVAQGVAPIRTVYADGGQHPDFAARGGDVSRPDALAQGPVDFPIDDGKSKAKKTSPLVQVAAAKAKAQAPTETVVAAAPVAEPVKTESSVLGRFFGGSSAPAAPALVAAEPATLPTSDVPLPPRRQQTTASVKPQPAGATTKTPAAKAGETAKPITGAAVVPPQGLSSYASAASLVH